MLPLLFVFARDGRAPGSTADRRKRGGAGIRCPRCHWHPRKLDRWICDPGCQHHWNTFETAGICPRCGKQWEQTACLWCDGWSPHADWYVNPD